MINYELSTLSNGIRVVSEFTPHYKSFSMGFWFNVGSRDENSSENGISHFIEHMLFKGTKKRTSKQIIDAIESSGGYINAFTSKEQICIYVRGLEEYFEKYFDVVADMIQNSLFKDSHIKTEAGVVIEELNDIEDNPEELIFDKFENELFKGNSLANPIIGTKENIKSFNSKTLKDFTKRFFNTNNLVISVSGSIKHNKILKLVESKINQLDIGKPTQRKSLNKTLSQDVFIQKEINQIYTIIGTDTYGFNDKRRLNIKVLSTLLGENSGSKLFQAVREKYGIAYQINTFLNSYIDVSSFGIFFSTNENNWEKANKIVNKQLNEIKEGKISEKQLNQVKRYIKGSMILGLENTTNRMMGMANSLFHYGRIMDVEEILSNIDLITVNDIVKSANEVFADGKLIQVIIANKNLLNKKAA
ncbi:MAG: insulinase family protein [Ignavibacterium sp.]|nr:insulinase family protein [Ignavibacterium sp.]MDW8375875.1 pitrilysin family protein [Ignavibacteriales bacterium]